MANTSGWLLPLSTGKDNLNYTNAGLRAWYARGNAHFVADNLTDFWWNDEGETQFFTYEYWNQAQRTELPANTRQFSINRAFTPGLQRFPGVVWSGDGSDCSHRMALQFARAGASLITCDMRSNDTGDARQLIQQYQNAVFLPVMRAHELHGKRPRFPFAWGGPREHDAFRGALQLRMHLLPQLYSWMHRGFRGLAQMAVPASWEFPCPVVGVPGRGGQVGGAARAATSEGATPPHAAAATCEWKETYLLGGAIVPADFESIEGTEASEVVVARLPPGLWYRLNTSAGAVKGPVVVRQKQARVDDIVAWVRAGAILTLQSSNIEYSDAMGGLLEVQVYSPAAAGAGGAGEAPRAPAPNVMVEDDGRTAPTGEAEGHATSKKTTWAWDEATKTLSWTSVGAFEGPNSYTTVQARLFTAAGAAGPGAAKLSSVHPFGSAGTISFA